MFFLIDVQPDRIDASRLSLSLWWADEGAVGAYRTQALSPEDAARAAAIRSPKATRDWRVSRALLQCVREAMPAPHTLSLSHSGGRALCARAPADWAVGVDLERMRPRATPPWPTGSATSPNGPGCGRRMAPSGSSAST